MSTYITGPNPKLCQLDYPHPGSHRHNDDDAGDFDDDGDEQGYAKGLGLKRSKRVFPTKTCPGVSIFYCWT